MTHIKSPLNILRFKRSSLLVCNWPILCCIGICLIYPNQWSNNCQKFSKSIILEDHFRSIHHDIHQSFHFPFHVEVYARQLKSEVFFRPMAKQEFNWTKSLNFYFASLLVGDWIADQRQNTTCDKPTSLFVIDRSFAIIVGVKSFADTRAGLCAL